ncbi:hypothetical protein GOP47_0027544 [Adiantum capillus-veneris]|nr:hypothetical protein GOP47_0027544 [Adiantum capillus-veneris]
MAKFELMNRAQCRPLGPCSSLHKRSLSITHQTESNLLSGRVFLCKGIKALHSGDTKGQLPGDGSALRLLRQHPTVLCHFARSRMLHVPNWCADNRLRTLSVLTFTNRDKFVAKIWRKDQDAQLSAFMEQSNSANEELLLFFFQLDLTTRLQRALNLDQYEAAQQLREKIVEVDKEVERLREANLGSVSSKAEAQDKAIAILRLKNDLQQAVQAENYNGAAELRDQISKLEAESLAAAARALVFQNVEYSFRLGQKVRHSKFGYRGVICGMDPLCSESESWSASALVQDLPRGRNQPFYQVLVDMRAEPDLLVAYVAEDNLVPPKEPDKDSFDHPYVSFLFYGMDSGGDFIPIKQLREKYNQARHELPWEDGKKDINSNDDNAKP